MGDKKKKGQNPRPARGAGLRPVDGPADPSSPNERALGFQPEWCRVTLASIGDAVITTDTRGRVTFLNPVAESLTGWTQDEAAGHELEEVFKIVNQESRRAVESPTLRALRDGVIIGLANHTLLIARDGTERPIDDSAAPIRNGHGELAGVVLVFRDITERYRHEQELQNAARYTASIIATLREPFLVLDRSLRVRTANRAFYRAFNVEKKETEGRYLYDLGNGQWNIPRLRKVLEEVLSDHHPVHDFEVEHDFPGIGRKTMLLNAARLESRNHQPDLILLAIEDTTERRRAEYDLQTSEVRYRRLFETAQDGILILDADTGEIIDANPFMTDLLGFSPDELTGKALWQIGLFEDKSANEAAFRELQEHGYVRYEHLPLKSERGTHVEVEFISNVYRVDGRKIAQCNIRDISERSRLQQELKRQWEELADLHRRKDEFLAMLGHELRNPLAPISNAARLLRLEQRKNPIQERASSIIERQVAQLIRLVDDLLEVSRITTGRIQLRPEMVEIGAIVERSVEAARPWIERGRQELTVSPLPREIWLMADPARLEQVLVNLLTNAAKYSRGEDHISLSVQQEGQECVLRVRDTGVGISPELLPRIFDLFSQAERSLDRSHGGLGIGLAVVQRLVAMHGGRVEAHSSLGLGSEFVVRLPMVAIHDAKSPPVEAVLASGPAVRVLVVDDQVDAAESLAMLLEAAGHQVRTAYDGKTALELARIHHPRAVLLDIGLPGMDGYEVARRLRLQFMPHEVLLIALTGYGQQSDRQRSLEAGFDHHLVKPADLGELQRILDTVRTVTA